MTRYEKIQDYYLKKGSRSLYQDYVIGEDSFWSLLKYELVINLMAGFPGVLGLFLRRMLFSKMVLQCGKGVVWGKDMVIRHPKKIRIADRCIFDDGCVLDAKGSTNQGITIGGSCILGRHSILGCKNSDIFLGHRVGVGSYCIFHAIDTSRVIVEDNVIIGPRVYLAGGSNYHFTRTDIPISEQGLDLKGGIIIRKNCWIGANTVILDGVTIGNDSIVGAGSVVTKTLPAFAIAVGNPAQVIRIRKDEAQA